MLASDRLQLWFQPIYEAATGSLVCNEVLLRVRGDNGEAELPGPFLALAERAGAMALVDRHVLGLAVERLAAEPRLRLTVNLSPASLDDGLADFLAARLRSVGVAADRLGLETDDRILARPGVIGGIARLRALGCPFALDDFGVGRTSFAQLRDLPVDFLKLDGLFVRGIDRDPVNQAIVAGLTGVAHALGIRTIAEAVENAAELATLRALGVDCIQGFHLSRPAPKAQQTRFTARGGTFLFGIGVAGAVLYLVKSALGINLLPGLHAWELPGQWMKFVFRLP